MKKFLTLFLILISLSVFAADAMSPNKDNYFVGGKEDVKFQISAKYNLIFPFDTGIYFAYSGMGLWDIKEQSAPFRDFNHNPEAFYQSGKYCVLDYIKITPYEHKSNGRDGINSRGIDRGYGQLQVSYGNQYNIGINGKAWYYYKKSGKNKDIADYSGYYEAELFLRILSTTVEGLEKEKLYVKGGCGKDYKKGWVEYGLITRIFTSKIQPRIFIQGFYGYGETLLDYNVKENAVRAGVVF